jgi:hypothetical protein
VAQPINTRIKHLKDGTEVMINALSFEICEDDNYLNQCGYLRLLTGCEWWRWQDMVLLVPVLGLQLETAWNERCKCIVIDLSTNA